MPDPLSDEIRAAIGEVLAGELDDLATLAGEDVVGLSDDVLSSRPEPFADFDVQQAATALAWERRTEEAWRQTLYAEEEVAVVEGLLRTDPWPELQSDLRDAKRDAEEVEVMRERLYDEMEEAGGFYLRDSFELYPHEPYDEQPAKEIVLDIAMARERAIRDVATAPAEEASMADLVDASAAGGPTPHYREVGTGNLAEILQRQRAARAATYRSRDRTAVTSLDELRRLLGEERYQRLAIQTENFAGRLAVLPGDMVRERAAELGRPDQNFPRDAADHKRRLDYALADAKLERDLASEQAERETNAERAVVAQHRAAYTEKRVARLEEELAPHRERLDDWMNSEDTIRRIAYADEVAAQHALAVDQHVALARDAPPQYLVDLIGTPDPNSVVVNVVRNNVRARDDSSQQLDDFGALRDPHALELMSWESIAREVEELRLSGRFDPNRGASAQSLIEQLPAELQSRINSLREGIATEPVQARIRRAARGIATAPPQNPWATLASREQRELDATDRASAWEERGLLEAMYEQYGGPLAFDEWAASFTRRAELVRAGIERPELPAGFPEALGPRRTERLERMVEDGLLGFAYSPPGQEQLSAQAAELEAAGGALDMALGERVAAVESRWEDHLETLREATILEADLAATVDALEEGPERERVRAELEAHRAHADLLGQEFRAVREELRALSSRDDHPDRWLDRDGQRFADAFAAKLHLEHQRTLTAAPVPEQVSRQVDDPTITTTAPREPRAGHRDLDAYRRLLGQRLRPVEEAAALIQQRESLPAIETADLETERAALNAELDYPLESLRRHEPYKTRSVQRDVAIAEGRLDVGLRELRDLGVVPSGERTSGGEQLGVLDRAKEMLGELRDSGMLAGEGSRRMTSAPHDHVTALAQILLQDHDKLVELRSVEQALIDDRVHLDQWTERYLNDERFKRLIATERELGSRMQRAVAGRGEAPQLDLPASGNQPALHQQPVQRAHQALGFGM